MYGVPSRLVCEEWSPNKNKKDAMCIRDRGFHDALCEMALDQCQTLNREHLPAALSGGVFLNRTLLDGVSDRLTAAGYRVLTHRRVSPGDEGLSLGQLAIAACQMNQRRNDHVSGCSA